MEFKIKLKELLETQIIDQSEVCNLSSLIDIKIYEELYDFFYTKISEMSEKHKISPVYFYIDNKNYCSAKSTFTDNIYIINVSQAYVQLYHDILLKNNNLFSSSALQRLHGNLCKAPNEFNLNIFFLHSSWTFTFYHEFRHLLQSNGEKFNFSESNDSGTFNLTRHVYEFDADRIGIRHVLDYAFDSCEKLSDKSEENLKSLIFSSLSSVVVTFLLYQHKVLEVYEQFPKNREMFYLEEGTHPHTLVRLANIIEFYTENINSNYPNLNIRLSELLGYCEIVIEEFFKSSLKLNDFTSLSQEFFDNLEDINSYNQKLYNECIQIPRIQQLIIDYPNDEYL